MKESNLPNGPAAAAILGAGLGSLALGLSTTLAEAIPSIKTALTLIAEVGSLSGITTVTLIIWLIIWAVLNRRWKNAQVNLAALLTFTLLLIGIGIIGTLPPFIEKFH